MSDTSKKTFKQKALDLAEVLQNLMHVTRETNANSHVFKKSRAMLVEFGYRPDDDEMDRLLLEHSLDRKVTDEEYAEHKKRVAQYREQGRKNEPK